MDIDRVTVEDGGKELWVPLKAKEPLVFADIRRGHHGEQAIPQRLAYVCLRPRLDTGGVEIVEQCMLSLDANAGRMVPGPSGEVVQG